MNWTVEFLPEALKDWKSLSGNQAAMVGKAIDRVQTNPLPVSEGGYGKPLGNKSGRNLSGMLKIKLRDAGIRIVYRLINTDTRMIIVVIGARADDEVYDAALKRREKYGL